MGQQTVRNAQYGDSFAMVSMDSIDVKFGQGQDELNFSFHDEGQSQAGTVKQLPVEKKLELQGIKKVQPKKQGSNLRSMMAESRMSKQSYLTTGSYAQRNENVPKKQRP